MEELKKALKNFGWDEELINACVDKQFNTIPVPNYYEYIPQFVDTSTIIISN